MIKLVASDLDGTLLHNYQQTVPKEIYDTIKALHERLRKRQFRLFIKHFMKKESSSLPQADASMPISAGFSLLSASTFHISLKMVPCASIKKRYSPPV